MSTVPPPPPPPNDPFPAPGGPDPFVNNGGSESLDTGAPKVSASPGRLIAVVGVVGALLLFLFFNIFYGGEDEEAEAPVREVVQAPLEPPPLPEAPEIITPPPTFVPPPVPEPISTPQIIEPEDDAAAIAQAQARMRSGMMVADGGGGLGDILGGGDQQSAVGNDPNSQFEAAFAKQTKADSIEASRVKGDLRRTIAQGRIIQATLESAINTDLPSPIRAIVSVDTFGEAGLTPMIPAGSRLIGRYNTDIAGGQGRVFVVWTRVIRPDGIDVMINSPGVDRIGMGGIAGQVDTHFQQMFARAFMASVVTIGTAVVSDEITGGGETSTTSSTFGTTQSGEGATTATVNALNRLGSTTDGFLQRFLNLKPTIIVDQGTPINVFVNRDVIFPSDLVGTRMVN